VAEIRKASVREMVESFANFLADIGISFIPVSSLNEFGLEELFGSIQQVISEFDEIETNI